MANIINLMDEDDGFLSIDEARSIPAQRKRTRPVFPLAPTILQEDDLLFPQFENNPGIGYRYPGSTIQIPKLRRSMNLVQNEVNYSLMDRVRLGTSPSTDDERTPILQAVHVKNVIDLTDNAPKHQVVLSNYNNERLKRYCIPLQDPEARSVQKCHYEHILYRVGDTVELLPYEGHGSAHFFRIDLIILKRYKYLFYGRHLCASFPSTLRGCERYDVSPVASFFPQIRGELVWMADEIDPVKPSEVLRHKKVVFLNARVNRFKDHEFQQVCRVRYSCKISSFNTKNHLIRYLNVEECDYRRALSSQYLRESWRGRTIPFGSGRSRDLGPIDLTVADFEKNQQAYTLGDAYCGGGGVSCGAKAAGFQPKWAVDIAAHACDTYRLNFDCIVENSSFDAFITSAPDELRVDVCHASPPCQPFSPAHTIANEERDEQNSACIFSALNLLEKAKPRILTMEETAGLPSRYPEILSRMIMDMVELGYSVRWTVLDANIYGVPQTRKRLLIIAAGPGEQVPDFPKGTHGGFGQPRFPGVSDCIDNIPLDAADHDVEGELERYMLSHKQPYDGSNPAKTITCSGGQANHHPSGKRGLTLREFACLQTFPVDFRFGNRNIKRMIGNAVPPRLSEVIYTEIRKSLQATDSLELHGGSL